MIGRMVRRRRNLLKGKLVRVEKREKERKRIVEKVEVIRERKRVRNEKKKRK